MGSAQKRPNFLFTYLNLLASYQWYQSITEFLDSELIDLWLHNYPTQGYEKSIFISQQTEKLVLG